MEIQCSFNNLCLDNCVNMLLCCAGYFNAALRHCTQRKAILMQASGKLQDLHSSPLTLLLQSRSLSLYSLSTRGQCSTVQYIVYSMQLARNHSIFSPHPHAIETFGPSLELEIV